MSPHRGAFPMRPQRPQTSSGSAVTAVETPRRPRLRAVRELVFGPRPPLEDVPRPEQLPASLSLRHERVMRVLLLILTLPLALLLAAPIALINMVLFGDPRRILFVQERVGQGGRSFRIYKFRTMTEAPLGAFASWRDGGDALRVTRFGRFLRNAHLDELPQLLNVLRGDMTFIGPRPEMLEVDAWAREVVPGFTRRYALLPGITGLAQVTQGYTGRDAGEYAQKLAHDLQYIRTADLRTDLTLLVRTALWMVRGRGWRWKDDRTSALESLERAA